MKRKTRRKLIIVTVATLMFVALWALVAHILGIDVGRTLVGAFVIGFGYGVFEEFYLQGRRGSWLRRMNALIEIVLSVAVLVLLLLVVMNLNHLVNMRYDRIGEAYRRLPVVLPVFIVFATVMVTMLRVISYIGGHNLVNLMLGKYRRPVLEHRVFMFLDMKESTELAENLGPLRTRELIGKLFYDISEPVTNYAGEIYRFTGDGVVVTWRVDPDDSLDFLVATVDDTVAAVQREAAYYDDLYGHVPEFRIGIHCGEIVVCEEGDMKRAIGYYGETIHIAARLEQEAKLRRVDCLLSREVVQRLGHYQDRLVDLGQVRLKGIREPVGIYQLSFRPGALAASGAEKVLEAC